MKKSLTLTILLFSAFAFAAVQPAQAAAPDISFDTPGDSPSAVPGEAPAPQPVFNPGLAPAVKTPKASAALSADNETPRFAKECRDDDDCPDNYICAEGWNGKGVCVADPSRPCDSNGDCPTGWTCIEGTCSNGGAAQSCKGNGDCRTGYVCCSGRCKYSTCSGKDALSLPGRSVAFEKSEDSRASGKCKTDRDCPKNYICAEGPNGQGFCVANPNRPCSHNGNCPTGWTCIAGTCSNGGAAQSCKGNGDCRTGYVCCDGRCKYSTCRN